MVGGGGGARLCGGVLRARCRTAASTLYLHSPLGLVARLEEEQEEHGEQKEQEGAVAWKRRFSLWGQWVRYRWGSRHCLLVELALGFGHLPFYELNPFIISRSPAVGEGVRVGLRREWVKALGLVWGLTCAE
jgi:hypothetical protein